MDHESTEFECDIWQGVCVMTRKSDGEMGSFSLSKNGRNSTKRVIDSDVAKFGAEKALKTYARLAGLG